MAGIRCGNTYTYVTYVALASIEEQDLRSWPMTYTYTLLISLFSDNVRLSPFNYIVAPGAGFLGQREMHL